MGDYYASPSLLTTTTTTTTLPINVPRSNLLQVEGRSVLLANFDIVLIVLYYKVNQDFLEQSCFCDNKKNKIYPLYSRHFPLNYMDLRWN